MTETEFKRLAAEGFNRVPLVLETFADLDTPLSIYLKLAAKPYSYLLESVQGGERFGRYSFIGLPAQAPHRRARAEGARHPRRERRRGGRAPDPLEFVRKYLGRFRAAPLAGLPRFAGGLVGCFGYDTVRHVEPKLERRPEKPDPIGTPDIVLLQSEEIAIVDNLAGKLYLVVYADPRNPHAYAHGRDRLRHLLAQPARPGRDPAARAGGRAPAAVGVRRGELPRRRWRRRSATSSTATSCRCRSRSGSRAALPATPLALYRALRTLNPSPYMFYFDFRDFHVVGASPEILVRLEGDKVTLRPIAGTRPRGATPEEDRGARGGAARRPEGARRARDADRSRPQRRRPRRRDRLGPRHRPDGDRALLARDAHRVERRGPAQAGPRRARGAARDVSRRAPSPARRRCARWRSSTSSSR